MTKTTRHLVAGLMTIGLAGIEGTAWAAQAESANTHLRTSSPSIGALIAQATEKSKTFRRIVDAINGSDAIVYVEEGACGHGVRACFFAVSMAGSHRILWVHVDMRKTDLELMGVIGHELRHTLEVLEERSVTSTSAMFMFYSRIGQHGTKNAFETTAATEAGEAVFNEIRNYQAGLRGN